MVKVGDIVEFNDEFNRRIDAKVVAVFEYENTKPTLTLQYKSGEGFQREIGSICHKDERQEGADGNRINCYGAVKKSSPEPEAVAVTKTEEESSSSNKSSE